MTSLENEMISGTSTTYEKEAKQFQKECVEAIKCGELQRVAQRADEDRKHLELAQNRLRVFQQESTKEAYYLGQIAALSSLCRVLNDISNTEMEFHNLEQRSPFLSKCIAYIGEHQMVTSGQIISDLGLKHRSNFSNTIKRQKEKAYITSYKIGNKNVYTLTGKGRQYYFNHLLQKDNIVVLKE